jgi:hypothetical protein
VKSQIPQAFMKFMKFGVDSWGEKRRMNGGVRQEGATKEGRQEVHEGRYTRLIKGKMQCCQMAVHKASRWSIYNVCRVLLDERLADTSVLRSPS